MKTTPAKIGICDPQNTSKRTNQLCNTPPPPFPTNTNPLTPFPTPPPYQVPLKGKSLLLNPTSTTNSPTLGKTQFPLRTSQ